MGHEHRSSDLHVMRWKPVVDADDFAHDATERLVVVRPGVVWPGVAPGRSGLDVHVAARRQVSGATCR
jgi:hypothetical protein